LSANFVAKELKVNLQPEVRFVSTNRFKVAEAKSILEKVGVKIIPASLKIEELQTKDTKNLVTDKLLKAYRQIGRPLFVEHTGLYLERLNGLPGGLTQIFWDTLEADRFCELFGQGPDNKVVAKTAIAHCDGRQIEFFFGEVGGTVVASPRGSRDFQWDCVFQPDGFELTFAEMGEKKNEISMRRMALDSLAKFLKDCQNA
jgi:XTP/dITP diphosphohydrolase